MALNFLGDAQIALKNWKINLALKPQVLEFTRQPGLEPIQVQIKEMGWQLERQPARQIPVAVSLWRWLYLAKLQRAGQRRRQMRRIVQSKMRPIARRSKICKLENGGKYRMENFTFVITVPLASRLGSRSVCGYENRVLAPRRSLFSPSRQTTFKPLKRKQRK